MDKKRIIIDITTIYPGKGGAGGGIWSYASNMLYQIDENYQNMGLEILCLANSTFSLSLKNMPVKIIPYNFNNLIIRLLHVHILLPIFCKLKGSCLHKLYFEVPFFSLTKTAVTIHDCMAEYYLENNYYNGIKEWLLFKYNSILTQRAVNNCKIVFTPSESVKKELHHRYKVSLNKIIVTPLATVTGSKLKSNEPINKNTPINVYCIAAIHKHKGHQKLIDIFNKIICEFNQNVYLHFRGHISNTSYYTELKQQISTLGLAENIKFVNYVPSVSIGEIYSKIDWIILLSECEGFGLPLIEAQANGVPVICSDIPVFKEVAGNGAFYVDIKEQPNNIANKINLILSEEKTKQELILKGYENTKRYNWDHLSMQIQSAYNKL